MRTWFSVIAILVAVLYVEPARADTPADVYSDFATDGTLSCGHSRSAMTGILEDASLYQYGDPLTFLQLKLAIRRQLAGGCQARNPANPEDAGTTETGEVGGTGSTKGGTKKPQKPSQSVSGAQEKSRAVQSGVERGGGMAILGAGLLLLALGSGGWAAKRAFTN